MREAVYDKLSQAQTCAQMDDMQCARKLLDEVREMKNLNSYESGPDVELLRLHLFLAG